jgi:hypothetical protein
MAAGPEVVDRIFAHAKTAASVLTEEEILELIEPRR